MYKKPNFARLIIEQLEKGTVPWRRPWQSELAREWKSSRPYWGFNQYFLDPGEYATRKQIEASGGRVREGMLPNLVWFYNYRFKKDENGQEIGYSVWGHHEIYEINSQCVGLKSNLSENEKKVRKAVQPIASCEEICTAFAALPSSPEIRHSINDRAFYSPIEDFIHLPNQEMFETTEQYYATLFHEMMHATGHRTRLRRRGITGKNKFGDEKYSKEELIAEIGAGILCNYAHIDHMTIENTASYLASWLRVLENDRQLIFNAYRQAEKAVKYILANGVRV